MSSKFREFQVILNHYRIAKFRGISAIIFYYFTRIEKYDHQQGRTFHIYLLGGLFSALPNFFETTCFVRMEPVMSQRITVCISLISKCIVKNISVNTVRHSMMFVNGFVTSHTSVIC